MYLLLNLHQYSTLLKQVVMVNRDHRWEDLEDHLEGDSQVEEDSHLEEEDLLLEVGSLQGVDLLLEGEDSEEGEEVTGEFQSRNLINRIR